MWLKDSRCEKVVKDAWECGQLVGSDCVLQEYLERCKANLSAWNDSEFGHVGRNTMELQTKLEWIELQLVSNEILEVLRHTQIELNCWLDRENDMWRQRSMINWFQNGDRNTSFFHAKASARQRKNFMHGLLDDDGDLFSTSNPMEFSELLLAVKPKVTEAMNDWLVHPFV